MERGKIILNFEVSFIKFGILDQKLCLNQLKRIKISIFEIAKKRLNSTNQISRKKERLIITFCMNKDWKSFICKQFHFKKRNFFLGHPVELGFHLQINPYDN